MSLGFIHLDFYYNDSVRPNFLYLTVKEGGFSPGTREVYLLQKSEEFLEKSEVLQYVPRYSVGDGGGYLSL